MAQLKLSGNISARSEGELTPHLRYLNHLSLAQQPAATEVVFPVVIGGPVLESLGKESFHDDEHEALISGYTWPRGSDWSMPCGGEMCIVMTLSAALMPRGCKMESPSDRTAFVGVEIGMADGRVLVPDL